MYKLAHIGIVVQSCERSVEFYTRVLGLELVDRHNNKELTIIELKTGSLVIELLQYLSAPPEPRGTGIYDHLAFMVEDIESEMARLRGYGVVFLAEKPRLALNGKKIIFFTGPDGERIELLEEGYQAE